MAVVETFEYQSVREPLMQRSWSFAIKRLLVLLFSDNLGGEGKAGLTEPNRWYPGRDSNECLEIVTAAPT